MPHTTSNRHASDTRIGLMDSTVQEETLVSGAPPIPVRVEKTEHVHPVKAAKTVLQEGVIAAKKG